MMGSAHGKDQDEAPDERTDQQASSERFQQVPDALWAPRGWHRWERQVLLSGTLEASGQLGGLPSGGLRHGKSGVAPRHLEQLLRQLFPLAALVKGRDILMILVRHDEDLLSLGYSVAGSNEARSRRRALAVRLLTVPTGTARICAVSFTPSSWPNRRLSTSRCSKLRCFRAASSSAWRSWRSTQAGGSHSSISVSNQSACRATSRQD